MLHYTWKILHVFFFPTFYILYYNLFYYIYNFKKDFISRILQPETFGLGKWFAGDSLGNAPSLTHTTPTCHLITLLKILLKATSVYIFNLLWFWVIAFELYFIRKNTCSLNVKSILNLFALSEKVLRQTYEMLIKKKDFSKWIYKHHISKYFCEKTINELEKKMFNMNVIHGDI